MIACNDYSNSAPGIPGIPASTQPGFPISARGSDEAILAGATKHTSSRVFRRESYSTILVSRLSSKKVQTPKVCSKPQSKTDGKKVRSQPSKQSSWSEATLPIEEDSSDHNYASNPASPSALSHGSPSTSVALTKKGLRLPYLSPQHYLDGLLQTRGYSMGRINSLQTAYRSRPTELQKVSGLPLPPLLLP